VILPHGNDHGVGTGGSNSMDEGDRGTGTIGSDDGGIVTNNGRGRSTSNGRQVTATKHLNLNSLKINKQ